MNKTKKYVILAVAMVLILAIVIAIYIDNKILEVNKIDIYTDIPLDYDGFRIALVSDLHNYEFGKDNCELILKLQDSNPDIIAFTGDLIDGSKPDINKALHLVEETVKIAPCYYVTGNHETKIDKDLLTSLIKSLHDMGVTILLDTKITIGDNEEITIIGLLDPILRGYNPSEELINGLIEEDSFNICLTHRPELFETYASTDIDLVMAGHAHGGQFRIPFLGGLFAPNQGLFPQYTSGLYTLNNTSMVVSRGVGESVIPFRINNHAEIVLIELHPEEK